MHAQQPQLCRECLDAFLAALRQDPELGTATRICWCEHELTLVICEVINGWCARWSIEGPLDPEVVSKLMSEWNEIDLPQPALAVVHH